MLKKLVSPDLIAQRSGRNHLLLHLLCLIMTKLRRPDEIRRTDGFLYQESASEMAEEGRKKAPDLTPRFCKRYWIVRLGREKPRVNCNWEVPR